MLDLTNKRYAYVAVITDKGYSIGLAIEGEKGYRPSNYEYNTWQQAQETANLMNDKLGLSRKEASEIVIKTMF